MDERHVKNGRWLRGKIPAVSFGPFFSIWTGARILLLGSFLVLTAFSEAALDESIKKEWTFGPGKAGWNGGKGPGGQWPARDQMLVLTAEKVAPAPTAYVQELCLNASEVQVVQIEMYASAVASVRLAFSTAVSPMRDARKTVEFECRKEPGISTYTLDLRKVETWTDTLSSLSLSFPGLAGNAPVRIRAIRLLVGDKIRNPFIYSDYKILDRKPVKAFRLASIFSSGMVLQRGGPVPVWGKADPGSVIRVSFAGQSVETKADGRGSWRVELKAMPASDEGRILTVQSKNAKGEETLTLEDVLVGDVWLCAGQSNMGGNPKDQDVPEGSRKELLETDYPTLRFVNVPTLHRDRPLSNDEGEENFPWRTATAAQVQRGFSAISYFFGQAMVRHGKVPIVLLLVVKAGSQAEQWMSEETVGGLYSPDQLAVVGQKRLTAGLYNGMVFPLAPFAIRGAVWYQGESNSDNETLFLGYGRVLPALINCWRKIWGTEFPILLVQLPRFQGSYPPESWAHIREAQRQAAAKMPGVFMAVSLDVGDPQNLHPTNKYTVGTRLALLARARVLGETLVTYQGPVPTGLTVQGPQARVSFDSVGSGLVLRPPQDGFELLGPQGWEAARVEAVKSTAGGVVDTLTFVSPSGAVPRAVRYAWANVPTATLFNEEGLPGTPFQIGDLAP